MIVEVYSAPGRSTADRVLGFVQAYAVAHDGATPPLQAIAAGLGIGIGAVGSALHQLERDGRITTTIRLSPGPTVPGPGPGPRLGSGCTASTGKRLHG